MKIFLHLLFWFQLIFANAASLQKISFGAILPKTSLITVQRSYYKRISDAVESMVTKRHNNFNFTKHYQIAQAQVVPMSLTPSPTEILSTLCTQLLSKSVTALIYLTNSEVYGSNAASAQYLLQLTGYLGIPVIAWNADNIGLKQSQRASESRILQLAPSVDHQVSAMLSILDHYKWKQFSIVTSQIGGHDDFVRAVRDQVLASTTKYIVLDIVTIKAKSTEEATVELKELTTSEARVLLLYCSREEAEHIMSAANHLNITGKNYVWIATQAVVGTAVDFVASSFPPGMLGVHFNTTIGRLLDEIERAVYVFGNALELFTNERKNLNISLSPNLQCNGTSQSRWARGDYFFGYLRNVSIRTKYGRPNLEFNSDGTLKFVELDIMNLNKKGFWEKIGVWTEKGIDIMNLNKKGFWEKIGVWTEKGIDIKDIVWPGGSNVPPPGLPEKFNLKVAFLEEPSYVNLVPPDIETGECKTSRAVKCRVLQHNATITNTSTASPHSKWQYMCCSGFCIDLLQKFAHDLRFSYDLYRVEDGKWGALNNGTWNGLINDLLKNKADIVVTSIKINSDRQSVVDFTVPFLETGIAIAVAKRTGIISPKAFLEPFDTFSWLMILLICIQGAAIAIFLFEWLSPYGYDMKMLPPLEHRFSLFRTYWLVWAILFGAAVNVDCPKGYTARFMSNVWAMFAVVFLAIYTANLAAFMITREEFYDLSGIEDKRLQNPTAQFPHFKYGTIPHGNTETVLKRNKYKLYQYMKKYNKPSVLEGIKAVKKEELDAFIYDATVLEYLVGQDSECKLLTVGSWYAMTGYGFALPKKSKYLNMFNRKMIEYRESGDLERFQRFWLQGACKPTKNKRNVSNPLDVNQFMSAFLLLGCGVLLTIVLLFFEHIYFRYIRHHLARKDGGGCFSLVSMSVGKSLSFHGAVFEAQHILRNHRCRNNSCNNKLWKIRHELDLAKLKIERLEAELGASRLSSSYRDFTRVQVLTNDPQNYYFPRLKASQVSEIETVL